MFQACLERKILNFMFSDVLTCWLWGLLPQNNSANVISKAMTATKIHTDKDPFQPAPVHSPMEILKPEANAATKFMETENIPVISPIFAGNSFLI